MVNILEESCRLILTQEDKRRKKKMIVPEILLSTSLISLVIFIWTFINQWSSTSKVCERPSTQQKSEDTRRKRKSGAPLTKNEDVAVSYPEPEEPVGGDEDSVPSITPLSSTQGSPRVADTNSGLSRRQRKNRKREKEDSKAKKSSKQSLCRTNSNEKSNTSVVRSKKRSVPCKQYDRLEMADHDIYAYLSSFTLTQDQQRQLGFPQDSSLYPGKAYIYRDPELCQTVQDELEDGDWFESKLDVNAVPFVPSEAELRVHRGFYDSDSSDSSGASSTPERKSSVDESSGIALNVTAKEFVPNSIQEKSSPKLRPSDGILKLSPRNSSCDNSTEISTTKMPSQVIERKCVRCKKTFLTDGEGSYLELEECRYHWGKVRAGPREQELSCCGAASRDRRPGTGCERASAHVWSGLPQSSGILGPMSGFVKTKHRKTYPANGNFGVYALDCEMCYTGLGLELVKVTVVGIDGRLVYESLVYPEHDIIDFNTRFSGITAKDLDFGQCKNLKEVQNDLMGFINADTIIVGHGLENDLRALKLIHNTILDTAVVFPHFYGLPYRRSLKALVSCYLKKEIQQSYWGHDSYEDARACMELMLWKTRKDQAAMSKKLTGKLRPGTIN